MMLISIMAVGVAKPKAQGQAINKTVTALLNAKLKGAPANVHEAKVRPEITYGYQHHEQSHLTSSRST
jgi:hypothetical protein